MFKPGRSFGAMFSRKNEVDHVFKGGLFFVRKGPSGKHVSSPPIICANTFFNRDVLQGWPHWDLTLANADGENVEPEVMQSGFGVKFLFGLATFGKVAGEFLSEF